MQLNTINSNNSNINKFYNVSRSFHVLTDRANSVNNIGTEAAENSK